MSDWPDHFCPGCGVKRKATPRYVWHFCNDCRKRATNGSGRVVQCQNESMSGGFQWRYEGDEDWTSCRGLYALISNRDVYLSEARFGGIVAQPLTSRQRAEGLEGSFRNMDIRKD
ncbi:hypothetical protein [uncultured Litoreibacter sp.]|uniref:hypothetical protein n=1 Tax=uncultured Litoreibacter sp. TaxID=1392394 RepID=UPI002638C77B|nr:hypothetical protein [uncultured Litoreibacter sp.]